MKQHGDCYIVTGSIGPKYTPRLYAKRADAQQYCREILQDGKAEGVWPPYRPVIEPRDRQDMLRMPLCTS